MPTLVLYNTKIVAQTTAYTAHQTIGDPQLIACTSVADATTKLQTALGSTAGAAQAATHATNFQNRVTGNAALTTHAMNFGGSVGAQATYKP
jgi:hypothetical protein